MSQIMYMVWKIYKLKNKNHPKREGVNVSTRQLSPSYLNALMIRSSFPTWVSLTLRDLLEAIAKKLSKGSTETFVCNLKNKAEMICFNSHNERVKIERKFKIKSNRNLYRIRKAQTLSIPSNWSKISLSISLNLIN